MKRILVLMGITICIWLPARSALAKGTAAGTSIVNQASVSYKVDAATITKPSNEVTITVGEVIDLTLTWQDSANVLVKPEETGRMLTFQLANTGNYTESFLLDVDNGIAAGDNFNPGGVPKVYLDVNDNKAYDDGVDTLYNAGSNLPSLPADGKIFLFVFNDIPAGPADGDLGISRLIATAQTGTGDPGDAFANKGGDGSVAAVIGASGGTAFDDGIYQVSLVDVQITKSVAVTDPFGGNQPIPGSTITYTIEVEVSGSGVAKELAVTDPIPVETTYTAGTLKLDGAQLSDPADADAGAVVETPAGSGRYEVRVSLGDTAAGPPKAITFDVIIK